MCKIIDVFYGYQEIAELLFSGVDIQSYDEYRLVHKAVAAVDKLLPYNWMWKINDYKMLVPGDYTKMDVNEVVRGYIFQVINHYRKKVLE